MNGCIVYCQSQVLQSLGKWSWHSCCQWQSFKHDHKCQHYQVILPVKVRWSYDLPVSPSFAIWPKHSTDMCWCNPIFIGRLHIVTACFRCSAGHALEGCISVHYALMPYWLQPPPPSPVATLLEHLGSNVCSKFHKNRGILRSISQNHDMGLFHTWYFKKTKKVYFEISQCLSYVLSKLLCKLEHLLRC